MDKVVIATKNSAKLRAAELELLPTTLGTELITFSVASGVSDQPKSLRETFEGARNRATGALKQANADLALGLEAGVEEIGSRLVDIGLPTS